MRTAIIGRYYEQHIGPAIDDWYDLTAPLYTGDDD